MKNLLTLLIALGFVFGVSACGGSTTTTEESTPEATEAIEATEEVEATETEVMEATDEADSTAVEAEAPEEEDGDQ